MFKENFGNFIANFYYNFFLNVNDNQDVMLNMHKLCIISYVIIVQSMHQIQEHKQKKRFISYYK
jgi:hypothetical protein